MRPSFRRAFRAAMLASVLSFLLSGAGCIRINSAQDFNLPTLDGETFSLANHRGKVVLITFWTTGCSECLHQMRFFAELRRTYADAGLLVLAISVDGPRTRADVRRSAENAGIDFPVLLDEDTTIINRYNPTRELPYTVLVNRDGTLRVRLSGLYYQGRSSRLIAEIEAALRASNGPSAAPPG